jgi:phosphate transport system protein
MVMATRTVFNRQLSDLQDSVLHLSEMVIAQVMQATEALQRHDMSLAHHVDEYDATVNRLRYNIEENCYRLLALQQPNAGDMRRIVSTVSIATNLERMGDHAAGIARLALRMEGTPCNVYVSELDAMADLAKSNLSDAMTALVSDDALLARAVVKQDATIDELHKEVYDRLIKTMTADPTTVECATMLLWVSHNLERYADRISNICERIIYMITGDLRKPRSDPMP